MVLGFHSFCVFDLDYSLWVLLDCLYNIGISMVIDLFLKKCSAYCSAILGDFFVQHIQRKITYSLKHCCLAPFSQYQHHSNYLSKFVLY